MKNVFTFTYVCHCPDLLTPYFKLQLLQDTLQDHYKIIPKGISIKFRPSFDTDDQHVFRGLRSLLRKTSFKMMNLLKRTYKEHYKKTKIKLRDSPRTAEIYLSWIHF